jgi:hypothetical protein
MSHTATVYSSCASLGCRAKRVQGRVIFEKVHSLIALDAVSKGPKGQMGVDTKSVKPVRPGVYINDSF